MDIEQKSYKTSHMGNLYGKKYDSELYKTGLFEYEMWQKEKEIIEDVVAKYCPKGKLLDFACGTGRIIGFLEENFAEAVGIDISSEMLKQTRDKVKNAKLICGDFSIEPDLVTGLFDCITSFRFFLNAEQKLRDDAFKFIKSKLRDENSIFIFNIHGNKYSTHWFKCTYDRLFRRIHRNELSFYEVKQMLDYHGFKIVDYFGLGFIFKVFYKFIPKLLWNFIENTIEGVPFLKRFSSNLLFVCKKA